MCMATPESATLGLHGYISPVLAGADGEPCDAANIRSLFALDSAESLFLLANTTEQYCQYASRLVLDIDFRERVGSAGQQFAHHYLSNCARPAASYSRHLAEIIAED